MDLNLTGLRSTRAVGWLSADSLFRSQPWSRIDFGHVIAAVAVHDDDCHQQGGRDADYDSQLAAGKRTRGFRCGGHQRFPLDRTHHRTPQLVRSFLWSGPFDQRRNLLELFQLAAQFRVRFEFLLEFGPLRQRKLIVEPR